MLLKRSEAIHTGLWAVTTPPDAEAPVLSGWPEFRSAGTNTGVEAER